MKRIAVIGATGNIGRQVVSQLPVTSVRVRALVRDPQTARLPPHVEVIRGDLTVPDTLDEGLNANDGVVEAVFLTWTAPHSAIDHSADFRA